MKLRECSNADCPGPDGHGTRPDVRNRYALCIGCASTECKSCRHCHHALPPYELSAISDSHSDLNSESVVESSTLRGSSICSERTEELAGLSDYISNTDVFDIADLVLFHGRAAFVVRVLERSRLRVSFMRRDGSQISSTIKSQFAAMVSQCQGEEERVRRFRLIGRACYYCETAGCTTRLKLCAGCSVARYCSKGCQKKDWPDHRQDCHHLSHFDWQLQISRCLARGVRPAAFTEEVD